MPIPQDDYVSIKDLVLALAQQQTQQKNQQKQGTFAGTPMKLAFVFMGGGARGAYSAGVLEGMMQIIKTFNAGTGNPQNQIDLQPDLVVGTSVGAMVGYGHWLQRVFPGPTPGAAPTPCLNRQSTLWQNVAFQNNGAARLVDCPMLIEYGTGKKPIPLLSDIFLLAQKVKQDKDTVAQEMKNLGLALGALQTDLTSTNFSSVLGTLSTDLGRLSSGLSTLVGSVLSTHPPGPTALANALRAEAGLARTTVTDFDNVSGITQLISDAQTALTDGLRLALGSGALANDTAALAYNIEALLLALDTLLAPLTILFAYCGLDLAAGGLILAALPQSEGSLDDHLLGNRPLANVLTNILEQSPGVARAATPGGSTMSQPFEESVGKNWLFRAHSEGLPELFVTASNLTSGRLMVMAVAGNESLQRLARSDYWTVDLARASTQAHDNLFLPADPFPVGLAVKTSASVPVAFSPVRWKLLRPSAPNNGQIEQVMVDGGVMNNSPVDVALALGATHIISFELRPLLDFTTGWIQTDPQHYNMVSAYTSSFDASRDYSLRQVIGAVTTQNARASAPHIPGHPYPVAPPVPVYRIAPLRHPGPSDGNASADPTVGFVDFDGHYDSQHNLTMNIEDWFMQGYQDAVQMPSEAMALHGGLDKVFPDYANRAAPAPGSTSPPSGARGPDVINYTKNAAWVAMTSPYPTVPPP